MNDELLRRVIGQYTEKRPVAVDDEYPDAHTVWLKVGVQSFQVIPDYAENSEHAEWFRKMLGKALMKIIEEHAVFDRKSDCRDRQTAVLSKIALAVWDDVKAQGASDMEALAMVYHAGANHLRDATGTEQ